MRTKARHVLKLTVVSLVALTLILIAAGFAYRAYRQHQNANAFAIPSPPGIVEGGYVKIGGIDQYVQIRGDDIRNPVVLILHGGPGSSYIPATYIFLRWEKYFTVVQWDQRGTGRTFGRNRQHGSGEMSTERMAKDGVEVAEYLRQRLHQDKIILYGTSWGTILGTIMAQRRPDLLYVYVGSGQVVDMAKNEAIGYHTLFRTVTQAHDKKAIAALQAIGPPPYNSVAELGAERQWYWRFAPSVEIDFRKSVLPNVLFSPDYSFQDILDYNAGSTFSIKALFKDMTSTNMPSFGMKFQVPIIFIQGTDDSLTPTSLVQEYFASISAPRKELVLIPHGGHLVSLAMPDEMLAEFIEHVRPLAVDVP